MAHFTVPVVESRTRWWVVDVLKVVKSPTAIRSFVPSVARVIAFT